MKAPNGALFCRSSIVEPAGEGDRASRWNGLMFGLLPHGLESGGSGVRARQTSFKSLKVHRYDSSHR